MEIELAKMSEKDRAKPAEILEKIIGGKIAKIVNEVTLYGQDYVLDPNQKVEAVLKAAGAEVVGFQRLAVRSDEHTSELQSLMRISYAVFCLQKKITSHPVL